MSCHDSTIPSLYVFLLRLSVCLYSSFLPSSQEEYDTHDPKGHCPTILPFLRKRSKIIEIVAAHDIVFALAQSGICAAFSRGQWVESFGYVYKYTWFTDQNLCLIVELDSDGKYYFFIAETNQRICFLNVSPDEVIRSLFYNKNNDSLITVSVYASDNFSSLKCRTTRIECVNF